MRQEFERWGQAVDGLDKWLKRAGTLAGVIVALGVVLPPFGRTLTLASAWRFGAHGVVKYQLGDDMRRPSPDGGPMRALPTNGQFRVLRSGAIEFDDIRRGDILQAASEVNFHEAGDCIEQRVCASARTVFVLQRGDCVAVLSHAYPDDDPDDLCAKEKDPCFKKKKGGWLTVATAACGLFK